MNADEQLQILLDHFILLDCRLRDHPKLGASIYLQKEDSLRCTADSGVIKTNLLGNSLNLSTSVTGHSLQQQRVTVIPDVSSPLGDGFWQRETLKSMACVPMMGDSSPIGVVNIYSSSHMDFKAHIPRIQLLTALLTYVQMQLGRGIGIPSAFSRSLGTALAELRKELALSQTEVAQLAGTSRIAVSRWESGAQPPSIGLLRRWCEALGLLSNADKGLVTVVDVSAQLLELLKKEPDQLARITPEQFERVVADRLDHMGYDVKLTGSTTARDGGIDLVAVPKQRTLGTFLLAGQVKHHRTSLKTGREAVDRLLAWQGGIFRLGLLVTNTSFTKDAIWVASEDRNKNFLLLRDFEDLKRWLQDNFWSKEEWREVPDEIVLAPGVVVQVPKPMLTTTRTLWPLDIVTGDGRPE